MPIQLRYLDGGIGVEFISSSIVTGAEIIAANRELYSHESFPRQKYQIIDRTDCTEFLVSHEDIQQIAKQDVTARKTNPDLKIALISTTALQYGISRMYQAYVGDDEFLTQIFQDRESAEEWIKHQLPEAIQILKFENDLRAEV